MLLTGVAQVSAVAQGAPRKFTQWPWIEYPTFQLRGGHTISELSLGKRKLLKNPERKKIFITVNSLSIHLGVIRIISASAVSNLDQCRDWL